LLLSSLNNFPKYENETREKSLQTLYLFSSLRLSPTAYRPFFAVPSTVIPADQPPLSDTLDSTFNKKGTLSSTFGATNFPHQQDQDKYPLDLKFLILPGLYDLSYFHELLQSTTCALQIHQEDLLTRALNHTNVESYMKLLNEEPGGVGLPLSTLAAAAAAPAKGKGAGSMVAAAASGPFVPTLTKMMNSDQFLITTIQNSLNMSKMLRCHGAGRFRMEQLLSKSNDLLAKFQMKRENAELNQVSVKVNFSSSLFFNCFCLLNFIYFL
jgi:hypothetical protein